MFQNYDLTNVKSPVDYRVLNRLLTESGYDINETKYLVDGFKNGFHLGYEGDREIKLKAPNLKFEIGKRSRVME